MELDCPRFTNMIAEWTLSLIEEDWWFYSIEIREQRPDAENTIWSFNCLPHFGMTDCADVDSAVIRMGLINGTLPHWSNEAWNLEFVKQLVGFVNNTMTDTTRIDKKDRVFCFIQEIQDDRKNFFLRFSFVLSQVQIALLLQVWTWNQWILTNGNRYLTLSSKPCPWGAWDRQVSHGRRLWRRVCQSQMARLECRQDSLVFR